MNLANDIESKIEKLSLKTENATDEKILKDAFAEFDQSSSSKSLTGQQKTGENVNNTRFMKIAAVAAIIIIFLAISLAKLSGKKPLPEQIYNAILSKGDFSIFSYDANSQDPYQQIWVSKSLDVKLFKTIQADSEILTLWNIAKKNKMISEVSSNSIRVEAIDDKMLAEFEESMVQAFSLSCFSNMNEIPKDAMWKRINDSDIVNQIPDVDVYELIWQQEKAVGLLEYLKWRMFLIKKTNLPKRAELYSKFASDEQYELERLTIFSYPEKNEIIALIRENFNTVISDPIYRPTGGQ